MCMGGKPSTPKQAPPAPPSPDATPPIQTPDQASSDSLESVGGSRKAGLARKGLRIDLTGGTEGSGIRLPLD